MINAFRMRREARKAKREVAKNLRKEAKKETENLLRCCKGYAQNGYYRMDGANHYETASLRNTIAYNLRKKGFKVETANCSSSYAITSISWQK